MKVILQILPKIGCHGNVPWDIKRGPDPSSASKTLSFGEKIAKISPAILRSFVSEKSLKKMRKKKRKKLRKVKYISLSAGLLSGLKIGPVDSDIIVSNKENVIVGTFTVVALFTPVWNQMICFLAVYTITAVICRSTFSIKHNILTNCSLHVRKRVHSTNM